MWDFPATYDNDPLFNQRRQMPLCPAACNARTSASVPLGNQGKSTGISGIICLYNHGTGTPTGSHVFLICIIQKWGFFLLQIFPSNILKQSQVTGLLKGSKAFPSGERHFWSHPCLPRDAGEAQMDRWQSSTGCEVHLCGKYWKLYLCWFYSAQGFNTANVHCSMSIVQCPSFNGHRMELSSACHMSCF